MKYQLKRNNTIDPINYYAFLRIFSLHTERKSLNTKIFSFWEGTKYRKHQIFNEMFEKVSVLLDYPAVSWEEFVAVDDDNVSKSPIITEKDILEFVQSSKNIIDADSTDGNEMK
ncbi:SCAN domain-containing protein 3 [Trichonephila clavipes]|nr:SCAN domain-containing protein 3 [Trichonephila clavipes]